MNIVCTENIFFLTTYMSFDRSNSQINDIYIIT